ncbi:hypothetical protein A2U01_0085834, partial [Trifolium medium]|nr:hypothetical protein [Trifolium medium]
STPPRPIFDASQYTKKDSLASGKINTGAVVNLFLSS